jgi:predicted NAD/FAD-dependent oxidoreductase
MIMIARGRRNNKLFKFLSMALSSSSAAAMNTPQPLSVKVCVVGGGVGGCAALTSLLSPPNNDIPTLLLEMGRGVGGRASTRMSRDDPRIAINHGAPHAEIRTEEGLSIMKKLEKGGFVKQSQLSRECTSEDKTAIKKSEYWTGNPNMSSICEGLLDSLQNKPEFLFRSMVRAVEPIIATDQTVEGWLLKDKDGITLVKTEWLIVAGSGIAHPRWTAAFGGEPPLLTASRVVSNKALDSALDSIASVHSRPVQVAMMTFEVQNGSFWNSMSESSVLETPEDDILDKLVIQKSKDGSLVSVVAHSNAEFAESAKDTYGSKSTAARIGGATSSAEREQEVLDLLMVAVQRNLVKLSKESSSQVSEPSWGPFLHRWGNAFPEGSSLPLEKAVVEDAKVSSMRKDYVNFVLNGRLTSTIFTILFW